MSGPDRCAEALGTDSASPEALQSVGLAVRPIRMRAVHTIWPNGKTRKEELTRRLDRIERLLWTHRNPPKRFPTRCANHLADALGCLTKCLLTAADQALDAAEKAASETAPEPAKPPKTFTLQDLEEIVRCQRASLPRGPGHPKDGWPQ